jgi:hypothetical protein
LPQLLNILRTVGKKLACLSEFGLEIKLVLFGFLTQLLYLLAYLKEIK